MTCLCGIDHDADRDRAAVEAHAADGFVRDVSDALALSYWSPPDPTRSDRPDGYRFWSDDTAVLTLNRGDGRWHWAVTVYGMHVDGGTQSHTRQYGAHVNRDEALAEAERWLAQDPANRRRGPAPWAYDPLPDPDKVDL